MLNRTTFFIREHVGMLKLSDTYDILDAETQEPIGIAKENPGGLVHVLRFFINKQTLPTEIRVYEGTDPKDESKLLFSIKRGFTLLRSRVEVIDANGEVVGWFKRKLMSLGGAFRVFNSSDQEVATVKGDWKGWNFRFLDQDENEMGSITKKWAGIGKELFSSADNYIVSLKDTADPAKAMLLLAAGLAVDTVFKE
ncbi:MAG: phospholipid scramblase-related protein [Planctomycetota bacterium]